jgi:hypothetical protein
MFLGIILGKFSRDFTRPLGNPRGLKRLVAYAECNRLSHKRGFMFHAFILFLFCFAKGLAKYKFWGI